MNNAARAEQSKKMRRFRLIAVPLLALIVLLALVLFKKFYLDRPETFTRGDVELNGPYRVVKVSDGDTFSVKMDGKSTSIRMIGIDAPESVAPSESGKTNSKEGREASDHLKKLLNDKNVYLEYDLNYMDQYGRVLAYVYLSDQETMLQEKLLSEGYVQVMTVPPNIKYSERFLELQKKAREEGAGFWKDTWK